jgi:glycosyltransferase involved in cell wall biosynthesis
MQLHLIRGLLDSPSIVQYADRIADGVRRHRADIGIDEVHAPSPSRFPIGRIGRGIATQAIRYGWYPLRARKIRGGINHITDHLHAHLLDYLDSQCSIITCHDLTTFVHRENITSTSLFPSITSKIFQYSVDRLHNAARIIAVSENTKRDILKYSRCTSDQVRVVYHGVDPIFQENVASDKVMEFRRRLAPDGSRLLLHVGLNAPYKNVESVLRVLHVLNNRLAESVRLVKVGHEFTPSQRKLIEELGLADRIVHLGKLERSDLAVAYHSSDVLLFPSIYEGFGWPPLEAMSAGTPVVSSTAGAIPEVVGDAGLLEEPTNVGKLADAVFSLLTNNELRLQMIQSGLRRAKLFTWQRSISELVSIYEDVGMAGPRCHLG